MAEPEIEPQRAQRAQSQRETGSEGIEPRSAQRVRALLTVYADGRVVMAPGATLGEIIFAFNTLDVARRSVRLGGPESAREPEAA